MQRLRVKFNRGEELKFISHLDIMRLWERALRRAGVPLAYSQGFSPHPQISLAAPLSVGMTGESELMDVFCTRAVTPHWFKGAVNHQLPAGISITDAQQVAPTLPSLQASVRFADYRVTVAMEKSREEVEDAINHLLSLEKLPWEHRRDTGVKKYDLRELVDSVRLADWDPGRCTLDMRLRCDNSGSGRPEQVTAALGISVRPEVIHRTQLVIKAGYTIAKKD
jgi:radical SAM-linked protein